MAKRNSPHAQQGETGPAKPQFGQARFFDDNLLGEISTEKWIANDNESNNVMKTEDNILLTPTGHQVHLHARDGIRSVRIDRLVLANDLTFAHDLTLSLAIYDEAGFMLWSEGLTTYFQSEDLKEAPVGQTFAVWESLTIGIDGTSGPPSSQDFAFQIRVYYTINPD